MLAWRAGALGDTIALFPALAALRRRYPNAVLDAVGTPAYLDLARQAGLVDRVWDAGDPLFAALFGGHEGGPRNGGTPLGRWLRGVDLAVVWSGAAQALADGLRAGGVARVLTAAVLPPDPQPVSAYLLRCLAPLDVADQTPLIMPRLEPTAEARTATESAWRAATGGDGAPVAMLHPGAGSLAKRWPLARFVELAGLLRSEGWRVAWTCGPADQGVEEGLRAAGQPEAAILVGWPLPQLCALLARSAAVVAADTGIGHLAAVLAVPTVALFGPTDERVWGPLGPRVRVVRAGQCARPAGLASGAACPIEPCCLRGITAQRALREVLTLQAPPRGRRPGTR